MPERAVMVQGWCRIAFLHWRCDPARLAPRLPPGLRADVFDGSAWIGLTPFRLEGLRPPGLPALPWLSTFPETNLRTYVSGPAGPGIWFFSLDAARAAAVVGARLAYGLPYHWATMRVAADGRRVRYTSARAGARAAIKVEPGARIPQPDARERFLVERYRLYTVRRGELAAAPVAHPPWPLHRATLLALTETLREAAGLPHGDAPTCVHYSPGVRARVGWPRRIGERGLLTG
jgi:uncharacterized protein